MYDRILVPVDGSDIASAAADHAFELARTVDADLHVLFVVDESVESMLLSTHSMRTILESLRERGEAVLDSVEDRAETAGVAVTTTLGHGVQVHQEIVEYCTDHDVDLVVMGTSGREGLEHLLGSTTERVLMSSSIPVLAVSPESIVEDGDSTG
ncbi:universal stress protein [Halomarina oriensis]|uniref:Universal stress protein n=1 Tax=Halomarina oriensis TaxID=671145 RepID=A0A6B0GK54_9EURY|nr:universal stress protein [Halomarina oriensis]MWG35306.1 universal stress protein [Halomarina oriensis]